MIKDNFSKRWNSTNKIILCSAVSSVVWCGSVQAQSAADSKEKFALDEIVVTAQRREQSINDVPIAITALGGDEMRDRGIQNFGDIIEAVPNVAMTSFYASRAEITIRGVAMSESFLSTDQQPTGIYQDDVFLGSRAVHLSQIFDLDRVEILRGPQGVLFGRNTTAGAVNYISKAPGEDFGGHMRGTYGNYGTGELSAALNLPIADKWGLRLSGKARTTDGWAKNVFTGNDVMSHDSWAARAVLQYTGDSSVWTMNLHGSDYDGDENYYFNPAIPDNQGLDWDEFNQRLEEAAEKIEAWGGSLRGSFSLGDIDVITITAYEANEYDAIEDFGVGSTGINNQPLFAQFEPFVAGYHDDYEQLSQEIRFSGGTDTLDWVGGFFAYYEDVDSEYSDGGYGLGTIGLDFNGNGVIDVPGEGWFPEDDRRVWNQTTKEVAAFMHVNYAINEQFMVLGGLRYTYSEKELEWQYTDFLTGTDYVPKTELDDSWDPITYRLGVQYTPDSASMYYFRYDHGFKNGGFNVGGSTRADLAIVDEETIDTFEGGAKFTLADGKAQLNVAVFHSEIDDYQANVAIPTEFGIGFGFRNAAKVTSKGAELELTARPTETLLISGGLGYTDSKYDDYVDPGTLEDYSGNRLPIVPEWSANLSLSNDFFIGGNYVLTPRVDYSYMGEMEGRHYNYDDEVLEERHLLNGQLRLGTTDSTIYISAWIKNALDEEYVTKILGRNLEPFTRGIFEKRGWPRTYGVTVGYEW